MRLTRSHLFAAISIGCLSMAGVAVAAIFPDVPDGHIYQEEIEMLVGAQVIQGNPDGNFYPDRIVNRAEMLKMLYIAKGRIPDPLNVRCFPDVTIGSWYEPYVCDAAARRFVKGYADGTFRPADPVNRVEALKMISQIFEIPIPEVSEEDRDIVKFVDVSVAAWYTKYLFAAFTKGILPIEGQDGARFYPDWPLLRGEAAAYIFNALYVDLTESRRSSSSASSSSVSSSEESNVLDVSYPFELTGKFNQKRPFSYRFSIGNNATIAIKAQLQSAQPGKISCRLYLLGDAGFSDRYFLGYQQDDTCEILATVEPGQYQLQLQPTEPDTTYSISAVAGTGDGNDGFIEAKQLDLGVVRTEFLSGGDLEDWYTFTIPNEGEYLVEVSNTAQLRCIVYASGDIDLYGFSGPECNRHYVYPPGTYYVAVGREAPKGAQQTYTVRLDRR